MTTRSIDPAYATGWYQDAATGQYYYYDAVAGRWYVYAAGYLYALAEREWIEAPEMKDCKVGDKISITASWKYCGPAKDCYLYGALGLGGGLDVENPSGSDPFEEGDHKTSPVVHMTESDTFKDYSETVSDIEVVDRLWIPYHSRYYSLYGRKIHIYAKLVDSIDLELGKTLSPYYYHAFQVAELVPAFSEFGMATFSKI